MEIRFFKALCDPNRVAILADLAQCGVPCTVRQIAAALPVDVSVVSRHLALLRDAEVLGAQKRGKEVYYSVRYQRLARTLRAIADAIDACCPTDAVKSKESDDE
ncbi:MAG: ArsR/SmtB family transcription factor [Alphaproteobacteria bacterium]